MSAQSLFSKKNIKSQKPDTQTGIMEELNLPPQVISFVRKNAQYLQIGLACTVVLILAWVFYDYYTEKQENESASLLAAALQVEEVEQRSSMLDSVASEYSRTDAALWATIELAHIDYQEGRFDIAAAKYEEIAGTLSADSSLLPLVRLNLAQSYEETGNYDKAVSQYTLLKKINGFKEAAHLALARIYIVQEKSSLARQEYEELLSGLNDEADPQLRSRVEAIIASLGGEGSTPVSQPE